MDAIGDSVPQAEPTVVEVIASPDSVPAPTDPVPAPTDPVPAPSDPVPVPTDPVSSLTDPVSAPVDSVSALADVVPDSVVPSLNHSELVNTGAVDPDPVQVYPGPSQTDLGEAVASIEPSSQAPETSPAQSTVACTGEILPPEDIAAGQSLTVKANCPIWCLLFVPCYKAITVNCSEQSCC